MMYVLLIVGFILLIKGADFFVDGASSTAKLLKVPSVIIGLTIVAMGTSAPEAAVSISAGLSGSSDIALSNVIGSNIFNLLIVVGVSAIICPMKTEKVILRRDIWWSLGAAAATLIMMTDMKISGAEGILLLGGMAAYIAVLVFDARKKRDEGDEVKAMSPLKSIIYIVGGLAAIIIGGDLVVDSACDIAAAFGMSEALIGLTIVALGTSLPELATSLIAAAKKNCDIALGNVVGSNIFNVFMILGCSAAIKPLPSYPGFVLDSIMAALGCVLVWVFVMTNKKHQIRWWHGAIMLIVYGGYLGWRLVTA